MSKLGSSLMAGSLMALIAVSASAQSDVSKKHSSHVAKKATGADPSTARPAKVQPRLVALAAEKCIGCESKLRKRVALMPVKVGSLATELNLSGETLAAMVRDQIEAELATRPGLIVLSRSEIGDVIAEQRISDSAMANQELAPAKGRVIPAQFVVAATIERVDAHETSRKESNSSAEAYEKEALAKEREADELEADAARKENERVSSNTAAYMGVACAAGGLFCAGLKGQAYLDCYQRSQQKQEECNEKAREEQERDLERKRAENAREASDKRTEAATMRREAQRLRQQAAIEAEQNVTVTQSKTVEASMAWRAVDTSTSAVVASGSESGTADETQRGVSQSSAFRSTSTTDSSKYQVVVNRAVATVVTNLAKAVEEKLATEPFRAKVVRVSAEGIVINGGTNVGMGVGDTFGVRKKHEILTDPDTGAPLETPGPPVGVIRVSEVNEKTAFAQVITTAGPIDRGDELEWIGVFNVASPNVGSSPSGTEH